MAKNTVEVCANCGKVNKQESDSFHCSDCESEVSVVLPKNIFLEMVKQGLVKE